MGLKKWISDRIDDAVIGKQERLNHELVQGAEQLTKDAAPKNPRPNGKKP